MTQRLWEQLIQIKGPSPLADRQVVIEYDHDPDTDVFTIDFAGAVITGGGTQDTGVALRHLVANHRHVVQQRFDKIVPTQYQSMYGGDTEAMERAVMQYVGYTVGFNPGQMPPYNGPSHTHGIGPGGHIAVSSGSGASGVMGQSSVTGTTTVTTTTSGTNPHSHQVPLPNSQQVLFPQEQLTENPAWEEAMSLVVEDITNVYGEAEEGSSMETLAAALLDTIRLFKERL